MSKDKVCYTIRNKATGEYYFHSKIWTTLKSFKAALTRFSNRTSGQVGDPISIYDFIKYPEQYEVVRLTETENICMKTWLDLRKYDKVSHTNKARQSRARKFRDRGFGFGIIDAGR